MDGGIGVILGGLIETVQATAPALWAIARRQVFAHSISCTIWGGLSFFVAVALGSAIRYSLRRFEKEGEAASYDQWDWGDIAWAARIGVVGALVTGVFCFHKVVMYTVNPDYYAIKVLLGLVR